jgi:hypothetical protein
MHTRANYVPRAERYAIPITILYRSAGELDWRPAVAENISRSGVLFRAERRLEPNTPLEMMLDIPPAISASVSGGAMRRGRVVRSVSSLIEDRAAIAAAFVDDQHALTIDPRRI